MIKRDLGSSWYDPNKKEKKKKKKDDITERLKEEGEIIIYFDKSPTLRPKHTEY